MRERVASQRAERRKGTKRRKRSSKKGRAKVVRRRR